MKHHVAIASVSLVLVHAACSSAPSRSETVAKPDMSAESKVSAGPSAPRSVEAKSSAGPSAPANTESKKEMPAMAVKEKTLWDFDATTLEGKPAKLDALKGKVVLVVNVASECGFTPQYAGLEKLHEQYASKGFTVVGFPCNDFGGQEPGDATAIRAFCTEKYAVTFPLYEKVVTKPGEKQSPIYAWLNATTGSLPNWNFCKYLIGKDGKPVKFWPSKVKPDATELTTAIDAALSAK